MKLIIHLFFPTGHGYLNTPLGDGGLWNPSLPASQYKPAPGFKQHYSSFKLLVMKPEMILTSSMLDILFNNRNKAYGAYDLRKHYQSRLYKALAGMMLFVLLFVVANLLQANFGKAVNLNYAKEITLSTVDEPKVVEKEKPKEKPAEKPKAKVASTPPEVPLVTPEIVPDPQANQNMATVDELEHATIGTNRKDGDSLALGQVQLPTGTPGGNGTIDEPEEPATNAPLEFAEIMPGFPGGMEAFKKFMLRHLREPDELNEGEKVVVKAKFVVDNSGSIIDVDITQSGGSALDAEVLRVIKKMPKWEPGRQNGKTVPVYFSLPVTFLGPQH